MNFQEAQDYLYSLGNEVTAMKLGLESVRRMLIELGDPQNRYLKVQVAGTNGKGSVCAFLNSICVTAGIRTGMYTSPHLMSITERVQIDGEPIGEETFASIATKVRQTAERLVADGVLEHTPTFFEQVTLIALQAFARAKVELAILETGLGGRLDATTAANAEIAAITRIDLDHQKYLGDTIEEIAAEKAAIIHADSKVVALRQSREVDAVIEGRCREVGVVPNWSTDLITIHREPTIAPSLIATFTTDRTNYAKLLFWNMLGEHQLENAAVAIRIAELLGDSGFRIDRRAVEIGLETAKHPGRLEWIGRFLLDGAHNIGGAKALREFIDEFVTRPVTMIFGLMEDKNASEIMKVLIPVAGKLIVTRPSNTRAMPIEDLAAIAREHIDPDRLFTSETVPGALELAVHISGSKDVLLVTGSLYLVGEARRSLLFGIGDK